MLSPEVLASKDELSEQLRQAVVVVKNALVPDIADQLYAELLASNAWSKQDTASWQKQGINVNDFTYQRDIIFMDDPLAPPSVQALNQYLRSEETRKWFSDISGRQCDEFTASATLFKEGDHITEHNDRYVYEEPGKPRYVRALTFNYYLTKSWDPDWGGNLVWKEPYQKITPQFNDLVLFNVTTNSHHWVESVKGEAGAPRLSITGWFITEIQEDQFKLSI